MLASKEKEETKEEQKQPEINNDNKIMVLWDFDWSLINENSDFYVMRKLFGEEEYDYKIYPKLDQDAAAIGVTIFTDIMDQFCWPKLWNDFKLNKQSFAKYICDIPIYPSNLHVIKTLGNEKYKNDIEQYVVSDANTVLIETILQHHKIFPNIIPSNQIYTNPGWYDEKTGIMRCKPYHTKDNPHNCELDKRSLNICKGKILNEEIMKNKNKNIIKIYIGDGGGDFCPITYFNENDFVFVRKYPKLRGLEKKIAKHNKIKLQCKIMQWKDGKELLNCFKSALPFVDF
eukprot:30654_1